MMRLLPDLCMRNSQGPGSHHAAGRSTVRTCMTSPLYLEPAGETVGRSAFSDRTGSVRRSRICVGTLPATNHNIRSCLSSATGSPESDVRRSTSNGDVHFALLPTAMDDDRRRQLLRPFTIDVHADVCRALSQESHRHPHGLHPYVQHRSEHTLRHTVVMAFELRGLVRKLGRSPTSLSGNRSLAYSAATRAGWFPQESIGLGQKPGAAGRNDSAACDIRGSSAETATISR
jgi:hypothetical protein